MSGVVITRRMAFPLRAQRHAGCALTAAELAELDALYLAYDQLELRERLLRAGYRLYARETQIRGVRRLCLAHQRPL